MTALERVLAARAELAAAEAALLGDRASAVAALSRLFLAMFSSDELRRGLRYHSPAVAATLPGVLASPSVLADAAAGGLLLSGVSADNLRPWLVGERPRRVPDIDAALAVWAGP